mgnify:CR=1 FL=1
MAIATNKGLAPTIKIIQHLRWVKFFHFVECSDNGVIMRDKNQMIKAIIEKDSDFRDANFVGDTVGDGLSAKNSKLRFIKANYGYGRTEDWGLIKIYKSIDALNELLVM